MKFHVFASLLVIAFASSASAARFSCYLSTWATYRPQGGTFNIEDLPGDICTHALYSFVGVSNQTWGVLHLDEGFDLGNAGLTRFTGLKSKYPNLKTIISVGGWGDGGKKYSELVSVPARRATFIASIIDFIKTYGFDGVDFDWEYPGTDYRGGQPSDFANFATFIQELRAALDRENRGYELSLAVTTVSSTLDNGYDVASLCRSVDAVNAMTYDLHGAWEGRADVHSPLNQRPQDTGSAAELNVKAGIQNWVSRGCPASKMIVGVPFYGKSYNIGDNNNNHEIGTPIVGPGDAGPFTRAPGTLAYYEVCDYVRNQGWTDRYDEAGQVPFAYQGHNWVGYENPRSVQAKRDFIRDGGFGGAFTWSIDTDDFRGVCGETFPLAKILKTVV